jgi:hypothetical protein
MMNWQTVRELFVDQRLPVPNVSVGQYDDLPTDGLTMGTLIIGRPGSGKTSALARHVVDYSRRFPDRAIFVLDWSGSISDAILKLVIGAADKDDLMKRLVYDELGHPEWVIPLPEFSSEYGEGYEDQVQRVSTNLVKLAPELVKDAPFLAGLGLREIAPQIFRILSSTTNEHGETWQVTEAKRMIMEAPLLRMATAKYGYKVPEAKWFIERMFLQLQPRVRELRTFAILALLGTIEPKNTRARVGYYRPGWTPKEAIEKGLIVLVNGARLINEENTQHYLFTQAYSLIKQELNRRTPGDPNDKPVALVMDEVYSLLSIPGMAKEVGMLSTLYRSRKLELYVVLQSLNQLAPELRNQIWSLGNVMCFAISNFDEAYEAAQQIFSFDPGRVKLASSPEFSRSIIETDRSQYLTIANWIQRLQHRQCVVRRFLNERKLDDRIRMVPKTKELPMSKVSENLTDIKLMLLKQRGVLVRDALEVINQRKLVIETPKKAPQL